MKFITDFAVQIGWTKLLPVLALVVVALIFYLIQKFRKSSARTFVLAKKEELKDKLMDAKKEAAELDTGRGTLASFYGLENEFRQIERLNRVVDNDDWLARREDVIAFEKKLADAVSRMRDIWKK